MEHKHTPGEWRLSEELNENLFGHSISVDVLDDRDFPIACVCARPIIHDWPSKFPEMNHWADGVADGLTSINRPASEVIQNARLIYAAPELLELVELVHLSFSGGNVVTFSDAQIEQFAAAIAKATGEQK